MTKTFTTSHVPRDRQQANTRWLSSTLPTDFWLGTLNSTRLKRRRPRFGIFS